MSIISHTLAQTAQIITTTTNFDGDQIQTATESILCRFRYVTEIDRTNNAESIDSADAIIWFEPTANISEGSIVLVDGHYWRVDSLVKARRLVGSTVMFLKAFVKRHQLATFS